MSCPAHAAFAVLRGGPGMDESVLLPAATASAEETGFRVAGAIGVEAESQLPFAGLRQLLVPLLPYGGPLPEPSRSVLEQVTALRPRHAPGGSASTDHCVRGFGTLRSHFPLGERELSGSPGSFSVTGLVLRR
ncbi:hypothetical protein [Streptomyces sp. NPDC058964]|uniref:hypothetical protein n=1 Tax=Streptomyces sp. NPDC058964 TaxID=3346681 RepID=UPI0036B9B349